MTSPNLQPVRSSSHLASGTTSSVAALSSTSRRGSFIGLFQRLAIRSDPPPVVPPSRSSSGGIAAKQDKISQDTASSILPQPPSPFERISSYLRTLFTDVTVTLHDTTLSICFVAITPKSPHNIQHCIPKELGDQYKIALEMPLEMLQAQPGSLYHQFLREVREHLVHLRCFSTNSKAPPLHCQNWTFPKLERLDFTGCTVSLTLLGSIQCPAKTLILRKAKGLSIADLTKFLDTRFLDKQPVSELDCTGIAIEALEYAFIREFSPLLFFYAMAVRFDDRPLGAHLYTFLKSLLGDAVLVQTARGEPCFEIYSMHVDLQLLKLVFHERVNVQTRLIVPFEQRNNQRVLDCIEWMKRLPRPVQLSLALSHLDELEELKNIELKQFYELKLPDGSGLTQSHFATISTAFPTLQSLNVRQCTFDSLEGMHLPSLRSLSLRYCPVRTLSALEGHSTLERLDLEATRRLTMDGCLQVLKSCPKLQMLKVSDCRWATDAGLFSLIQQCRSLESIVAIGCPVSGRLWSAFASKELGFTEMSLDLHHDLALHDVKVLSQVASRAEKLTLRMNGNRSNQDLITAFFHRGFQVRSLHVEDFGERNAELFFETLQGLGSLQKLKLTGPLECMGLMPVKHLRQLRSLSLTSDEILLQLRDKFVAVNAIDVSILSIGESLCGLETLTLAGFSELTIAGLRAVISHSKRLRLLRIRDCNKVAEDALRGLCVESGIKLQYSVSDLRFGLKRSKQQDRDAAEKEFATEIAELKTIIEDGLIVSHRAILENEKRIAVLQSLDGQIHSLQTDIQRVHTSCFSEMERFVTGFKEAKSVQNMTQTSFEGFQTQAKQIDTTLQQVTKLLKQLLEKKREVQPLLGRPVEAGKELELLQAELEGNSHLAERAVKVDEATLRRIDMLETCRLDLPNCPFVFSLCAKNKEAILPLIMAMAMDERCNGGALGLFLERMNKKSELSENFEISVLLNSEEGKILEEMIPVWRGVSNVKI